MGSQGFRYTRVDIIGGCFNASVIVLQIMHVLYLDEYSKYISGVEGITNEERGTCSLRLNRFI